MRSSATNPVVKRVNKVVAEAQELRREQAAYAEKRKALLKKTQQIGCIGRNPHQGAIDQAY